MKQDTETLLKKNMRDTLLRFVNARERAYREGKHKYHSNMKARQAKAITEIKRKLESSEKWGLKGTCLLILRLQEHINNILPSKMADPRQGIWRNNIAGLLNTAREHTSEPLAA